MVPNGWSLIKLKDIGKCINGLTYSPKNVVDNGLLVLRSSNVQGAKLAFDDNVYVNIDIASDSKTKVGDILLCVRNGSRNLIGKSAFIDESAEGLAHGAFMSLFRSNNTPNYTFQLFQSSRFFQQVNQNLGATINSINSGNLNQFKFPYPPLAERKKIAQILSTWDRGIATTEKLIDASKQQKKALMQQLLTGKKRLIDPETGKAFEGKWEEVKVKSLITQHSEKTERSGQYPVLTSSRKGIFFQSDYYNDRDVASEDTTGYNVVPRGFFTYRHMSDDLVFKFNINSLCDRGIVSTLYPVFAAKENIVVPYLLRAILNDGSEFKRFSLSQKQGGSRTYMYLSKLNELKIKIPKLKEQQKIVSTLTAADKEIELLETKLAHFKQEKKALMQQLLTGKRRVKVAETEAA
ncbi:TPA: restriction endonuclease subunit S [Vibrio parahaemolyticus]|nr:restriction endonuclease subunit S [Vibrio parahaemolyticus]